MTAVPVETLRALYARTDDPWHFRTSAYEREKYESTLAALPQRRFRHILEIGCGNGELAARLAARAAAYTGLDAVEVALSAARRAVPSGRFVRGFLPCDLPPGAYDLIVLSEILYFLDRPGLQALARQVDRRWPGAGLLCVTWRGPSGNPLQGEEALHFFRAATHRATTCLVARAEFRIDRFDPSGASCR